MLPKKKAAGDVLGLSRVPAKPRTTSSRPRRMKGIEVGPGGHTKRAGTVGGVRVKPR